MYRLLGLRKLGLLIEIAIGGAAVLRPRIRGEGQFSVLESGKKVLATLRVLH
jgi:hypothetical protein